MTVFTNRELEKYLTNLVLKTTEDKPANIYDEGLCLNLQKLEK